MFFAVCQFSCQRIFFQIRFWNFILNQKFSCKNNPANVFESKIYYQDNRTIYAFIFMFACGDILFSFSLHIDSYHQIYKIKLTNSVYKNHSLLNKIFFTTIHIENHTY